MAAHPRKARKDTGQSRITMVQAVEGIVRRGAVRLPPGAGIPDGARVYVLVAGEAPRARIFSPRLRRPEQAADFEMDITDAAV
jgi:hypothetical protein